jgi:hypothetical protein
MEAGGGANEVGMLLAGEAARKLSVFQFSMLAKCWLISATLLNSGLNFF